MLMFVFAEDEESTRDVKSVSHIFTKQLPGKSSKMTGKQAMCVESLVADIASLILTTRQNDESTVDTASLYMEKLTERGRDGDGGGRRGVDKHDSAPCEEQDRPPLCTVNKQVSLKIVLIIPLSLLPSLHHLYLFCLYLPLLPITSSHPPSIISSPLPPLSIASPPPSLLSLNPSFVAMSWYLVGNLWFVLVYHIKPL